MEIKELLEIVRKGQADVHEDSRKVSPGDVFVAISGVKADGSSFAADAARRGAKYIVCARHSQGNVAEMAPDAEILGVADPRDALRELAQARFGTENLPMKIIGVTGTNGKTTCAWLLEHFFSSLGQKTGLLGTISHRWPGYCESASLTTPGPLELHFLLAKMREAGVETVIMEVSSHALAQKRVGGIDFSGAIFTNLTQDHLDYHREMESYFRAKTKLFLTLPLADKAMSINADDRYGRRILELVPAALSYGLHKAMPGHRHLTGKIERQSLDGMTIDMELPELAWQMKTRLIGEFNALNLLAVSALAIQMGYSPDDLNHLESFAGVPGRLERVENPQGKHIFVDYAHTPDALANALKALRGTGFKRIITIFGCGGNRDRDKRPLMGKAVAENSDVAILTSDNPRNEAPEAIMRDVKPGLAKSRHSMFEVDRKAATARGLQLLGPDDALLIAGKGHENYQIVGEERHHYSDQEVVRELFKLRLTLLECAQALKLRPPLGCEEKEIAGAAIDSRQVKPGDLFFCLPGERVDGHDYAMKAAEKGCSAIIASRPVEAGGKPVLMAPDTEAALGILARLWREKTGVKTLCLTGTAGKTTLKECLAAIMSKAGKVAATQGNHNNQIGLPLTILNASGDENCWILEAGISHTGDMDYLGGIALPDMALILNVGAGHEEGLGEKGVAWHKTRLLNYVSSNGCSLVNADYPELLEAARNTGRKLILFGSRPGSGEDLQYVLVKSEANGSHTVKCPQGLYTFKTPFRAAYGGELTVAAVAAALSLGAGPEEIAAGFAAVKLPEQRFRRIQVGETLIFDDTYNANPLSMRRMLEAASSAAKEAGLPFYAMLGEMGELGKESSACHRSLGEHLAELGPKAVIWHGGYANDVLAGLAGQSPFIKVNSAEDFLKAWDEAALGDAACVVLFKGSRFNHLENHLAAFKSMLNAKGSHCVL